MKEFHRRSIRMKGYDYRNPGFYSVTTCTWRKECILAEIINQQVQLTAIGRVVEQCILEIPGQTTSFLWDTWVIMPNHVHMIIQLLQPKAESTLVVPDLSISQVSLSTIVQTLKAMASRRLNDLLDIRGSGNTLWQRNYYEHIIRSDTELFATRAYVQRNPANWLLDDENPQRFAYNK
jgi:putative transposase